MALKFPMPNDKIRSSTVVASVEYFDDERGTVALVLLLEPKAPYFTVGFYAMTDVDKAPNVTVAYKEGLVYTVGRYENIVYAVDSYVENGGAV